MLVLFDMRGFNEPSITAINAEYAVYERCPACGRVISSINPAGLRCVVGGSGNHWPDIFSGGTVIHERVVDALKSQNFSGFKEHEVEIVEVKNKALRKLSLPRYFNIEITGRFDVILGELDDVGGSVCPICFYRNAGEDNKYPFFPKRIVPQLESLGGADLLISRNLRNSRVFCSRRFVDLASNSRWTNFIFGESLPKVKLWEKPPKGGLSYLDPDWFHKLTKRVSEKYFGVSDE